MNLRAGALVNPKQQLPTDPKQQLRLTQGNNAQERSRGRRARRVFHGTLTAEINDRGAATVDELFLRFDCFLLPLTQDEIKQVLESARREGLVAEVPDQHDGYGEKVTGQWTTTEKGKKLSRPRTLALPDLGYLLIGEHDRWVKAFDVVKTGITAAIPGLALLGISELDPSAGTKWVGFAAAGAAMLFWIAYGLNGELDLRAAADSWPRLERQRRERWEYQLSWPCMAFLPGFLAVAYVAVGLWLAFGLFAGWVYAIAAGLLVALYLWLVFPKYRAWHRIDPQRCRTEWEARGKKRQRSGTGSDGRPGRSDRGEAAQSEAGDRQVGDE